MRIGVLSTSYPRYPADAAGRFVKDLADALSARGHQLEALFPEDRAIDHPPHDGEVALSPIAYLRPRGLERSFYGAGVLENLSSDPLALPGLLSFPPLLAAALYRRRRRYDALLTHFLIPSAWIASRLKIPQLAIAHSADLYLLERLPARRLIARSIDARARLLFISEEARGRFERVLGRAPRLPPIISPMGVPALKPIERSAARQALSIHADELAIVSLGRLVPIKGHAEVIDALAGLSPIHYGAHRGVHYLIGGEGPLAPSLRAQADAKGVRLSLLGPLDGEGKARLFSAGDLFVHGSIVLEGGRAEGVPVALLEALAAGLPALATDGGGIRSSLGESAQLRLIPPNDARALQAALEEQLHALEARGDKAPRRFNPPLHPITDAATLAAKVEAALSEAIADQGRTISVRRGGE